MQGKPDPSDALIVLSIFSAGIAAVALVVFLVVWLA